KDPAVLAPLEQFAATGVPTPVVLSRELSALTPALLQAAGAQTAETGVLGRLQANAERLVRIRPIDEAPGDDPQNMIARTELKASRTDMSGALADFAKLPPEVRTAADVWLKKAEGREAAITLARKINTDALAALNTAK